MHHLCFSSAEGWGKHRRAGESMLYPISQYSKNRRYVQCQIVIVETVVYGVAGGIGTRLRGEMVSMQRWGKTNYRFSVTGFVRLLPRPVHAVRY